MCECARVYGDSHHRGVEAQRSSEARSSQPFLFGLPKTEWQFFQQDLTLVFQVVSFLARPHTHTLRRGS